MRNLRVGSSVVRGILGTAAIACALVLAGCASKSTTQPPDLAIGVTHTGSPVAGANATYTIAVNNAGTGATTGAITVTDTLPAALSYVSGAGTGWNCSAAGQVVTCTNAGPISASAAAGSITLTVAVSATASGVVANGATVATTGDTNAANNTSTDPSPVTFAPTLAVTKAHSGNFTAGSNGSFTITVKNNGNGATTAAITVTDALNAAFTYVSGSAGWSCSAAGQNVTCTYSGAAIAPAATAPVLTLTVAVGGAISGAINNVAIANTTGSAPATSNTDTVTVNLIDLSISAAPAGIFAPPNPHAGASQTPSYTLAVNNVGNTATTAGTITVTDTLDAQLSYVAAGSGGGNWTCNGNGLSPVTVTCTNPGPIAGGASAPITINVSVNATALGSTSSTATITNAASLGDTNAVNNSSTATVVVNNCAEDPAQHGSESMLNGPYTFFAHGLAGNTAPGTPVALAASFTADGTGKVTDLGGGDGGDLDINQASGYTHVTLASSGSVYTVYPDPSGNAGLLGCMVLTSGSQGTRVFRFALNNVSGGVAGGGRVIEFDDVQNNGAANHVDGPLRLQTKAAFAANQLKTDYAFGVDGIDPSNFHFGEVGHIVVNSSGTITTSDVDSNDAGTPIATNASGGTGAIAGISSTTGRATLTLTPHGGTLATYAAYIVNASEMFLVGEDTQGSGHSIVAGRALASGASGSFSTASATGNFIYHGTGISTCGTSPCAEVNIALVNLNSTGAVLTGSNWDYTTGDATINTGTFQTGATYAVDSTFGRMTVAGTGGGAPPTFYLVTPATDGISALAVDSSSAATFALVEAQPAGTYSLASVASASYSVGTEDLNDITGDATAEAWNVDATGTVRGSTDDSSHTGQIFDRTLGVNGIPFPLVVNADGTGTFDPGSFIVTNGSKIFWVESGGAPAQIIVFEH